MWSEALRHIVGAWTEDLYQADGEFWRMGAPRRAAAGGRLQKPHPPLWGATSSPEGHHEIGKHGLGLCSFTVGVPPEDLKDRLQLYPRAWRRASSQSVVQERTGGDLYHGALCGEQTPKPSRTPRSRSLVRADGVKHIASLPDWMSELGSYGYAAS